MRENNGKLSERAERILKALIVHYMGRAIPAGSKRLQEEHDLPWSAATIRNEMAQMEEQHFLSHPHTSSGRVPTARGIRYFVDHLLELDTLPDLVKTKLQETFVEAHEDPVRLGYLVSQLLSRFSQYLGLVQLSVAGSQERVMAGKENFLGQPQFADSMKLKELFRVLEEEDELVTQIFRRAVSSEAVCVLIGSEDVPTPYRELFEDVSVIAAGYGRRGWTQGTIGIIGPTRMDYQRVIPLVDFTARRMENKLMENKLGESLGIHG